MDKKHLITGTIALMLGAVGGGVWGYKLGSGEREMQREITAGGGIEISTASQPPQSKPQDGAEDTSLSDDRFDKSFFSVKIDKDWDLGNFISWFQCRSFENDPSSGGLQIVVGHPLAHDPDFSKIRFEYRAQNVSARQLLDEFSKQTGIRYSIRPCAVLWEKPEAGNDKQPANGKTPEVPKSPNE